MTNHWVIAIGINQYQFLQPLHFAQQDAQALGECLIHYAGFAPERCMLLTDTSPQLFGRSTYPKGQHLQQWVTAIGQELIQPDDWVWYFFSGYGVCHHGQDYLLPVDGNPNQLATTGIAMRSLFAFLKTLPTQKVLVLLDINRAESTVSREQVGAETASLAHEFGIATVLSCRPEQFSHEITPLGHGLFTAALLEGLRSGQCSTLASLEDFLNARLPELCRHHHLSVQAPMLLVSDPEQLYQGITPIDWSATLSWPPDQGLFSHPERFPPTAAPPSPAQPNRPQTAPFNPPPLSPEHFRAPKAQPRTGIRPETPASLELEVPDSNVPKPGVPNPKLPKPEVPNPDLLASEVPDPTAAKFHAMMEAIASRGAFPFEEPFSLEDPSSGAPRSPDRNTNNYNLTDRRAEQPQDRMPASAFTSHDPALSNSPARKGVSTAQLEAAAVAAPAIEFSAADIDSEPRPTYTPDPVQPKATAEPILWRRFLLGGSMVLVGLLAGVLFRNWSMLTGTSTAKTNGRSQASLKSADFSAPRSGLNSAQPTPTQIPKPGQAKTPKPAKSQASSRVATSPSPTATASPKPPAGNAQSSPIAVPQSSAAILSRARSMIKPAMASDARRAITQALLIPPTDPLYAEAQQDIQRWSQNILDLAKQRAAQKKYRTAIAAAQFVPKETPQMAAEAAQLIQQWQRKF